MDAQVLLIAIFPADGRIENSPRIVAAPEDRLRLQIPCKCRRAGEWVGPLQTDLGRLSLTWSALSAPTALFNLRGNSTCNPPVLSGGRCWADQPLIVVMVKGRRGTGRRCFVRTDGAVRRHALNSRP